MDTCTAVVLRPFVVLTFTSSKGDWMTKFERGNWQGVRVRLLLCCSAAGGCGDYHFFCMCCTLEFEPLAAQRARAREREREREIYIHIQERH